MSVMGDVLALSRAPELGFFPPAVSGTSLLGPGPRQGSLVPMRSSKSVSFGRKRKLVYHRDDDVTPAFLDFQTLFFSRFFLRLRRLSFVSCTCCKCFGLSTCAV